MPYYRPPQERPRQARRFLTAREVEDMAAAGTVEIVHVDGLVITDAAREAAHDLGMRITQPSGPSQRAPAATTVARDVRIESARRDDVAAPRGAPAPGTPASGAAATGGSATAACARPADPLVDALVRAVRSNTPRLGTLARKG